MQLPQAAEPDCPRKKYFPRSPSIGWNAASGTRCSLTTGPAAGFRDSCQPRLRKGEQLANRPRRLRVILPEVGIASGSCRTKNPRSEALALDRQQSLVERVGLLRDTF